MTVLTFESLAGTREELIAALLEDEPFRLLRFKSVGNVSDRLVTIARNRATEAAAALIGPPLRAAYAQFLTLNNERPSTTFEADEWDSALDDEIMHALEPYANALSASWLNEATVDTRLHLDNEIDKLIASFGKEVWRQLTFKKETTAKTLSALGFGENDINAFLASYVARPEPTVLELEPDMNLNAVINKIMLHTGASGMPVAVFAAVIDGNDEGIEAYGIDADDAETIRMASYGGYTPDWMAERTTDGVVLDEADDATPGAALPNDPSGLAAEAVVDELTIPHALDVANNPNAPANIANGKGAPASAPPAIQTGDAPPPPATGRKKKDTTPPPGALAKETLQAIRDKAGVKDDDAATLLGFSRATYNNYVKGKAAFVPNDEQRDKLTNLVRDKANALLLTLTGLTGQPYDEV